MELEENKKDDANESGLNWFPFCQTVCCFFLFRHLCDLMSVFFSLSQSAYATLDVFRITVRKTVILTA